MATFKAQVEDYVAGIGDDSALTQWLTDGARLVLEALPTDKLERITEKEFFTNTTTSQGKRIFEVLRKDASNSDRFMPCRKLSPQLLGKVEDTDYMEAATTSDPAYIVFDNAIQTFPSSAATSDSMVLYVDTGITVAHGDSSIDDIPDEAECVVVLYAARSAQAYKIKDANIDEDPELVGSLIAQYNVIDAQYKEKIQLLGLDKLYVEKELPDRR
tara:strand:- start:243 stop:887 length:645 start_codon:yes stop_codon:yes gene_type:complete